MKKLINFIKEEEGATAVEYGLMIALIAAAIIIAVTALQDQLEASFNHVATKIGEVIPD